MSELRAATPNCMPQPRTGSRCSFTMRPLAPVPEHQTGPLHLSGSHEGRPAPASMTPETTGPKGLLCREVEDGREWRVMAGFGHCGLGIYRFCRAGGSAPRE